jgi:hypothetical protein
MLAGAGSKSAAGAGVKKISLNEFGTLPKSDWEVLLSHAIESLCSGK